MATVSVFQILDTKAETYSLPSYSQTIETARREFHTQINKEGAGYLYEYAEDYTLFYMGEYDQDTGTHILLPTARSIVNALKLKDQAPTDIVEQMGAALTRETTPQQIQMIKEK